MIAGYDVRKAAQVAAFFALKNGGSINVLKLAKLLYLAEREYMSRYDQPMFFDRFVSMDHGPVTSITYDLINGGIESEVWSSIIAERAGYNVPVRESIKSINDLDNLSKADFKVLNDLWEKFGPMDKYALRDYTHAHCLEWENPHGSSQPIPHERVFKFLGKKDSDKLDEEINEYRYLSRSLEVDCL